MTAVTTDWLDQTMAKLKRGNVVLFAKDSPLFAELSQIISRERHKVMVLWAFEFASQTVEALRRRYPDEVRPQLALDTARAWAAGNVKMPVAKRAILACHAFAKELNDPIDVALCHAIGQACGVVHANGHAIGYPVYDLTAIVLRSGIHNCREPVERRVGDYIERIAYWREHHADYEGPWAEFMTR